MPTYACLVIPLSLTYYCVPSPHMPTNVHPVIPSFPISLLCVTKVTSGTDMMSIKHHPPPCAIVLSRPCQIESYSGKIPMIYCRGDILSPSLGLYWVEHPKTPLQKEYIYFINDIYVTHYIYTIHYAVCYTLCIS